VQALFSEPQEVRRLIANPNLADLHINVRTCASLHPNAMGFVITCHCTNAHVLSPTSFNHCDHGILSLTSPSNYAIAIDADLAAEL
jgi:hypothetical protein